MESDSSTITGRIGLLSEVAEQVYVGVVFELASNPSKSVTYDLFGEGFGKLREELATNRPEEPFDLPLTLRPVGLCVPQAYFQ